MSFLREAIEPEMISSLTFQLFTSLSLEIRNRWVRFAGAVDIPEKKEGSVLNLLWMHLMFLVGQFGREAHAHQTARFPLLGMLCLHLPVITYSTSPDAMMHLHHSKRKFYHSGTIWVLFNIFLGILCFCSARLTKQCNDQKTLGKRGKGWSQHQ